MPERKYLTGAIQKPDGRLYPESVRLLQKGCGILFEPPTGRQRFSVVDDPRLKIGTEGNGGLAAGVATGKYHWAIAGLDMVENLPYDLRGKVDIVKKLGFQPCQYRLGVSMVAYGIKSLEELGEQRLNMRIIPQTMVELRRGTNIATKHVYYLDRCIKERGLDFRVVYDSTPETAPEFRGIRMVADIVRTGATFRAHMILPGEVLLESQAVLIKAGRLPRGTGQIFSELLTRVEEALANPERWLNPDSSDSSENDRKQVKNEKPKRRWDPRRLIPRPTGVEFAAVAHAALLIPLLTLSAFSSGHSRISEKKI